MDQEVQCLICTFAMQANLGFAAQYAATNTDPITNLTDHLKVCF